jgi:hypothetical protein
MISTKEEENWASEGDQLLEGDFLKPNTTKHCQLQGPQRTRKKQAYQNT